MMKAFDVVNAECGVCADLGKEICVMLCVCCKVQNLIPGGIYIYALGSPLSHLSLSLPLSPSLSLSYLPSLSSLSLPPSLSFSLYLLLSPSLSFSLSSSLSLSLNFGSDHIIPGQGSLGRPEDAKGNLGNTKGNLGRPEGIMREAWGYPE